MPKFWRRHRAKQGSHSVPLAPRNRSRLAATLTRTKHTVPLFTVAASVALLVACLYWAQAVLMPVALAILLTFFLSPVVNGLERIGLGRVISIGLVVVLAFSFLLTIGWIMTSQITTLAGELPTYESNIRKKIADVRQIAEKGTFQQVQKTIEGIKQEFEKTDEPKKKQRPPERIVVRADRWSGFFPIPVVIGPFVERLATAVLVIVLVIFMLAWREDMRNRLIRLIGYSHMSLTTRALEDAGERISRYLLTQAILNSVFGLSIGVGLFLIDLPYAVLWGLLAGLFRFVPYVGPWISASMPTLLSLAVFEGWIWPIVVIGLFVVLDLFVAMILEPLLYGESAGVSPVALLISIAFWAWLWGPIGLLLATPLTVCLVVLGKYVPQMQFINLLMSDEPIADDDMMYYQRLLAVDEEGATRIVEEYLKDHPRERIYDEVLLPALTFARVDRERHSLSDADEEFILKTTKALIEKIEAKEHSLDHTESPTDKSVAKGDVRVLGCPARDETDEVALWMFRQLLHGTKWELEVVGEEKLTSEVLADARKKKAGLVCIAGVPPGGIAQTRYLCKRLRTEFPNLKIVVGFWGLRGEVEPVRNSVISAGADDFGTTLSQTREQILSLAAVIEEPDRPGQPERVSSQIS